jgi:DnaK suppressor protein
VNELRARQLVAGERARIESALAELTSEVRDDEALQRQQTGDHEAAGSIVEAESMTAGREVELRAQLAAVVRAEERLALGTYGKSVESGATIPDARLEARPLAERTVEEQRDLESHAPKRAGS